MKEAENAIEVMLNDRYKIIVTNDEETGSVVARIFDKRDNKIGSRHTIRLENETPAEVEASPSGSFARITYTNGDGNYVEISGLDITVL